MAPDTEQQLQIRAFPKAKRFARCSRLLFDPLRCCECHGVWSTAWSKPSSERNRLQKLLILISATSNAC